MSADTTADHYEWFNDDDPRQSAKCLQWWPDDVFESPLSVGKMYSTLRPHEHDVAAQLETPIHTDVTFDDAQRMAIALGFTTEKACHGSD